MKNCRNMFAIAALALGAASSAFAAPVTYKEAAAPWSAAQAVKLAPALTPEILRSFEAERGPAAAAELAAKQKGVSGLLKRYSACALRQEDLKTAGKYLSKEFQAELNYFLNGGCAALKDGQAGNRPAPRPATLAAIEAGSASGAFATREGSIKFFDGSAGASSSLPEVKAAAPAARAAAAASAPQAAKNISYKVPELRAAALEKTRPDMPADIGRDGRVNQAVDYWSQLRRENWAAFRSGDAKGADKAKAFLKAAAGAGFGGLLFYSNLGNVEIAAARVRWDVKNGAGAGAIAADSGRFVFHSMVFVFALAPIPMLKVAQAALAGEVWAIGLLAAMATGPIDNYVTHIASVKREKGAA
ncbi:MAG: hypothetical protein HY952_02870 [Elusimicrobia bacterium]|nr:hypothetical protein [Elusimicrobiota bacterium]